MGTMLAQKKPLESIQRSQAINFVAEIFYDELQFILDRRLLDHTMVNCHGMNSRVKSRDVLSVSVQHIAATNADKEYILLNLARNSIYHQLPELLFHPLVLSTPGMSNKEIVEAIRANEKQDKELIQFFAPFDTEFFKEKVRINNRHLNFFSDPDSKKNFIKMIEVMENVELSITSHQKYKLFLFLCNAERYKENLPAIEQLLLIVLGLKVKLRLEVHEIDETVYLSVGSGCVGQTLGLNGLMISETDDLTATIILDTPTDDYEEVKTHLSNVRRILEFFILSTRNIEVDYLVRGETDFILGENRLGYNINEGKSQISEDELKYMHAKKTGELIRAAIVSGAILAEAPKKDIEAFDLFGRKLGLAFQIKDDILSEEGDEKILGKPVGNDKKLNKCTYVSKYGLEGAKDKLNKLIEEAINDIKVYGEKAEFLMGLAMYIKDREK